MLKLDWNIIFNIVNVFVLYLLMKKFLFGPITSIMDKRKNAIKTSFEEAENKNNEALKLKNEYLEALNNAEEKAASIIIEAKQRALEEHDKQIRATKVEISKMIEDANQLIAIERKKSMEDVQSEVAGIAMVIAAKLMQKNMDENTNKQLVNDFLTEAGVSK
jgi:F-type H+-transporting ATPase subunit b